MIIKTPSSCRAASGRIVIGQRRSSTQRSFDLLPRSVSGCTFYLPLRTKLMVCWRSIDSGVFSLVTAAATWPILQANPSSANGNPSGLVNPFRSTTIDRSRSWTGFLMKGNVSFSRTNLWTLFATTKSWNGLEMLRWSCWLGE